MARDLAARAHVTGGVLFVVLWVLVVVNLAPQATSIRRLGEIILVLVMTLAMLRASAHIRILAALLIGATLYLTVRGGDWSILDRGLGSALAVGAFLPVIVLLRCTVETSPALPAIRERVSAMTAPERRAWMTGGAHILASILTLAFVSVQRPMLPGALTPEERRELAECGVRGLGLAIVWSPFFVASAVATQLVSGVAAWQTVLLGWSLAAIGGFVAHWMFNPRLDARSLRRALRRLTPILLPTALLVGAVVLTASLAHWNVLQSVIVVIPLTCAAYLALHAPRETRKVFDQVVAGSGRLGDEVLILTASTIFGAAISGMAPPAALADALSALLDHAWLAILLEVIVIAGLGTLGLHPMVSASVLIPMTIALQIPIASVVLAHIVILAWALSAMVAPWTLPVVVTAAAFEVPVRRLVLGPNVRFVIVFGLVACAMLWLLSTMLLRAGFQ